ncbi:hypothetical protein [Morganella morganii]|uniref:hypothetical protein n=1 Tax=Morganella morganii TaxID=582 RepID=UPI001C449760|nr:hypothetical protein [Morganella morganii]QXO69037.1 hypothetical protein JC792_19235 [Morganella morganii]
MLHQKKTNSPYPSDSPVDAAFKILQVGENKWPSLLLFDSYANKVFLSSRRDPDGVFNPFLRFAMIDDVLGEAQKYADVSGGRKLGTTYTNTTGKTIFVMINCAKTSGASRVDVRIDTVSIPVGVSALSGATSSNTVCFPAPAGSEYSVSLGANDIGLTWLELR